MTNTPIEKGQSSQGGIETFPGISAEKKITSPEQTPTETPVEENKIPKEENKISSTNDKNDVDSTAGIYVSPEEQKFANEAYLERVKEEIKKSQVIDGNLCNAIIEEKKNNITPTID